MLRLLLAAAIALVAVACGGGADVGSDASPTFATTVRCDDTRFHVTFDPAASVSVKSGDEELAAAAFDGRSVSPDCAVTHEGTRITMERSPYDGTALGEPVYRRVELVCSAPGPIGIDVHPIFYGSDTVDGSNVLVLLGDAIVVSAVLKDEGNPRASRISHAAQYCSSA